MLLEVEELHGEFYAKLKKNNNKNSNKIYIY
jgi:hypothetical protein